MGGGISSREMTSWKIIVVIQVRDAGIAVVVEKSRQIQIHFGDKIRKT